jgi:hypothetical protein
LRSEDVDQLVRRVLTAAGFSEAVTFGFIEARVVDEFGGTQSAPSTQKDQTGKGLAGFAGFAFQDVVSIANPLSAKFDTLRPSLLPGLVDAVAHNRRHGRRDVQLFEIGTRFTTAGETRGVAMAWTGAAGSDHWSGGAREVDFFDVKGAAEHLARALGVPVRVEPVREPFLVDTDLLLLVNGWFLYRQSGILGAAVSAVEEAAHELGLLSEVLVRMEREQFRCPLLAGLRASLDAEGEPPSRQLARLKRLVENLDSRDNVVVRVLEPFVLWTPHLAVRVEDWRAQSGSAVRRWLQAAGDMEALCSLASHAFEHPADPFPEFVPEGPWIEAEALGHPLLAEDKVVRNDIRLGGALQVIVVSGSNMSGKSTLLRTLGVNAVLAQAGATVRAKRLRISPLAIGASIRVTDSLQGGVSRFYAEILRLRQILDLTGGPLPALFLIDEFLHGTNSLWPTRRICDLLDRILPEARLETIGGAGHMAPVTHRDQVNAMVIAHLDSNVRQVSRHPALAETRSVTYAESAE